MNKKVNAVLGLTIIVLFLIHIMYEIYAYLTFYYNPVLTKIIAYSALAVTGLHVLCSIYTVYVSHDKGRGMKYPALNIRTLLQRISAVMIVVLIIIHMNTFSILSKTSETNRAVFVLVLIIQIVFFASVLLHVAVSVTNALITLGLITSDKVRKTLDIIIWIVCALIFIAASVVIVRTQLAMFAPAGGAV